ncbi:TIGR01777 family oxidoreductase [Nocardioides sp. AE5]|uniref:TIGR01777 family oxidoreductase n=1 Tax=Nocardioides sp. AE5 TaxID=2962573 RepID=UPI002882B0B8|nr:TIGR01777 family oxidoreductase [Nocardioides sp. AE5]MDT0201753.1 TIGR01777 family oxidoreductase [Nocardioides sp. AE5]
MRIVVAGSSGFLGSHLVAHLVAEGHSVTRLVRHESRGDAHPSAPRVKSTAVTWDPYAAHLDQSVIDGADVVVNLAGAPLIGNPHSKKWAAALVNSRVTTTRFLADRIAASHTSGAGSPAYLAGNGISVYGDRGDEPVDEAHEADGTTLLAGVTRLWEDAAAPAAAAGARVAVLRTAPVISSHAAPLKPMLLPFRLGLGARLGTGSQFFPLISLRDWLGGVAHLAAHPDASGPFNLCCPDTPTNAEFTYALSAALGRNARLSVPRVVIERAAGPMAPEVLGSLRAEPRALMESGYDFADRDVRDVIAAALG